MARTELPNGIILPAEYSDDWYDDMTSNLSKLDEVIGSDADKLSEEDVGAAALSNDYTDLDNKPALKPVATSGDYTDLDNKPDLKPVATSGDYDDLTDLPTYGITRYCSSAITDNSSIAFSAISSTNKIKVGDFLLDINGKMYQISAVDTANETVSVTTPLTQLAVDSLVVHNSGNEDINGIKTFKDMIPIDGDYLGNEASTNQRTNICLRSNRDTADKSGAYITRFRQNRSQGALQPTDLQKIGFDVLENETRTNNVFDIQCTDWLNDIPQRVNFVSNAQSSSFGSSSKKSLVNDLNPGSLSLPDLNNGLDIRGSIDISQLSEYTAPADGYISICGYSSSTNAILIKDKNYDFGMTARAITTSLGATTYLIIPVVTNHVYEITCSAVNTLSYAYFYPCLGNV